MYRTTILLPEALKSACEDFARAHKMSLGELIRQQLKKVLNAPTADGGSPDPLFSMFVPYAGTAPTNLALQHDEELYGVPPLDRDNARGNARGNPRARARGPKRK